jgi:hypothetical protein
MDDERNFEVCIYICMCVFIQRKCAYAINSCRGMGSVDLKIARYIYIYIHTYVERDREIHTHIFHSRVIRLNVRKLACMYMYIHIHVHIQIYKYVYIHIQVTEADEEGAPVYMDFAFSEGLKHKTIQIAHAGTK